MKSMANPLAPRGNRLQTKSGQIKNWVTQTMNLPDDAHLSVAELACREENCPDIETVIGIFVAGKPTRTIRVHLTIMEVTLKDIEEAVSR